MRNIAFIGTGGTIASLGTDPFDVLDYNATGERLNAADLVARSGLQNVVASITPIDFRRLDSTAISIEDWHDLAKVCSVVAEDPRFDGIVIGHGTASLEETAWMLHLTMDLRIPIVLTGSMRPLSAMSSDAGANLLAALMVAASHHVRQGDIFVVVNGEIHDPVEVTKAHTFRLDAFVSPEVGPLGFVEGPDVKVARRCTRARRGLFDVGLLQSLPYVGVCYSHIGSDGRIIDALAKSGAKGIVSVGFAPGLATPAEREALGRAVEMGVAVVQAVRTAAGRVVDSKDNRALGIIPGGGLCPQKARLLLALCLARGDDSSAVATVFREV